VRARARARARGPLTQVTPLAAARAPFVLRSAHLRNIYTYIIAPRVPAAGEQVRGGRGTLLVYAKNSS